MATSSAILQSFLRDALKENKELADLSFEDLLKYNRAECGLIQIDPEQVNFEEDIEFDTISRLLHGNNGIVLQEGALYYVDINAEQKTVRIQFLEEPEELDPTAQTFEYHQSLRLQKQYKQLKKACSKKYQRAHGEELDAIRSLTGRAYAEHRSDNFLPSLEFYLGILDNTDTVMFTYMNDQQKEELAFNLKITLMLLAAQQKHEIDYQKTENAKKYGEYIKRCSKFLIELDPEYQNRIRIQKHLEEQLNSAQPVKYLGIPIGQLLAKDIIDLAGGTAKEIRDNMGILNEARLYWVWGSSFLKTVISLVPEDLYYQKQATDAIRMPDPYTGNLSWILYYARFALNLFLLLKHTIKHPWMSDEEAKTPWQERFLTQWSQRKFTLLNDSIWGTANLVCFFWLTGKGLLGTAGDAVTLALLVFDILIASWDLIEQSTKHNKAMLQYEEDLERLDRQLYLLQEREKLGQLQNEELKAKRQIEMQIKTLEREKLKCEREWQLQKVSLIVNIAYAVGLMAAFLILTMPFMPISAPVLASMAIAGAVLCLAFTIISSAIRGGIEIYKTYKNRQEQQEDAAQKIGELIKLLKESKDLNQDGKKLLYLEIKKCQAEAEYQKEMMVYQSVNLVRSILIQCMVPAVVFASLMFVPLGIGIPMLVMAAALAIASQLLVDALFKPEEKESLKFNDDDIEDNKEYTEFCNKLLEEPKPQPKPERSFIFSLWSKESPASEKIPLLGSEDGSTDTPAGTYSHDFC
ncbi:hypothetical protein OQJ13_09630 [Legionella sp. PATHC035]|uniref:hypothetical protein n=1 Tax=Legionella sp. PATHC035 TaxID=2992040 RepID=UPI00224360C5|nr:hypothetical protein [Legionella sp. PATHC035]MCW8409232.1 hypothetical protein [Legionella sp. PATHC035]